MPDDMKREFAPPPVPSTAQDQANQIPTDYSALSTVYTNFCRVNITPEELVLDFGLNPQISPTPTEPVKLTHRVVMNFFTAKRLLLALNNVVVQHENAYGALELDFQKRFRNVPRPITGGGARPNM
jgi:hypothetical protein